MRFELFKQRQPLIRQWCKPCHQGLKWRQIKAISTQQPLFLYFCALCLLGQCKTDIAPTLFAPTERQIIQEQLEALLGAGEISIQRQIIQRHRLALGVAGLELWHMQATDSPLHAAIGPAQPDLTTELQLLKPPLRQQARRHPGRPIALRQAQIQLGLGVLPVLGVYTRAQLQGKRLAIGQQQAAIQALARAAITQGEVYIGQGSCRLIEGLYGDLAVEQR